MHGYVTQIWTTNKKNYSNNNLIRIDFAFPVTWVLELFKYWSCLIFRAYTYSLIREYLTSTGYCGFIIIQTIMLPNFSHPRNFLMRVDFAPPAT